MHGMEVMRGHDVEAIEIHKGSSLVFHAAPLPSCIQRPDVLVSGFALAGSSGWRVVLKVLKLREDCRGPRLDSVRHQITSEAFPRLLLYVEGL